jgi:hypothetical protein
MNPDQNSQLTPEAFKQRILTAHPDGTASDGTPYKNLEAGDLLKRVIAKYPNGVTNDGHRYSDFGQTEVTPPEQKKGLLSKIGGFAGDVYNSIASPFVGLAATPLQAGIAGYNKITGSSVEDPFKKGLPSIAGQGKNTTVTDLNVEKKLGDAAQVGSYFVPGSGVLGAAGMGALQGAGSQMSKGASASQVAVGGAQGAAVGAGTALAVNGIGYGINKAGEALSGAGKDKAIAGIKDAYGKALNLSASQRAMEARTGKDLANVLMEHGAPLGKYADGTLDATGAISKLQPVLDQFDDQATQVLNRPDVASKVIDLQDILGGVQDRIRGMTMAAADKNLMLAEAEKYVQAEIAANGKAVAPALADTIKSGFWKAVGKGFDRDTVLRDNVTYLLGNETKKAIEGAVGDIADIGAINASRGNLIDAIRRLTKLDGVAKIRGGSLGNMAGGITGAIAGSPGGVLGTLAGDYFGTKTAAFLNDPAIRIAIAKGKAEAQGLLPGLLGKAAGPVGRGVSKFGGLVSKGARGAGLLGNLLTK